MSLLINILRTFFHRKLEVWVELIEIELAIFHLTFLSQLSFLAKKIGMVIGLILLATAGLLMVHVAIFMLIPADTYQKAWILLGIGLFYCLGAIFTISRLYTRLKSLTISNFPYLSNHLPK